MSIIKDGSGNGHSLKITAENRATIDSVSRSVTQHINEVYEKHFSLTFEGIDPVGADDYFFYLSNTGTKNIHLTKFRLRSTVVGSVELHRVTGTPTFTAGTDVTAANRFLGSSNSPVATIKTDTNTTGLTVEDVLIRLRLDTVDKDFVDEALSHIIIPPGQSFALMWDAATGILAGTIDMYEDQGFF